MGRIKKWISINGLVILCGISLYLKTILFYRQTISIGQEIETYTKVATLMYIMILLIPFCFFQNSRKRTIALCILNLGISILLLADEIYYAYSSDLLAIAQASNLQYTNEIISTIPSLLKLSQLFYLLDIIIVILLSKFRIMYVTKPKRNFGLAFISIIAVFILVESYFLPGIKIIIEEPYHKKKQIEVGTVYGYHMMDLVSSIQNKSNVKYQTYEEMIQEQQRLLRYEQNHFKQEYDMYEIAKAKNVLLLQLEAVQNFVIGKEINGQEITPNLNQFLKESVHFTNLHAQSFTTTADSEHAVINSIYPVENGQAFGQYYTNTYDDIFKLYSENNYTTAYFHGNVGTFWNRKNVFSNKLVNDLNFIDEFEDTSEKINTYLSDELLYRQAVQKMKNYQEPFLVNIVAASSHTPFELEGIIDKETKVTIDVGKYQKTPLGNYLEAVQYADYAFGILLDELKQENLYEDLVIVLYGDHFGLPMYQEEIEEYLQEQGINRNDTQKQLDFTNVVAGIKIPNVKPMQIHTPVGKIDIKPTLVQISGIRDGFSLGTSMFSSKDYVCLNNGRIITPDYYYNGVWTEIGTGEEVNFETLDEEKKRTLQEYEENMELELAISNSIVVNDLLKDRKIDYK